MKEPEQDRRDEESQEQEQKERYDAPELAKQKNLKRIAKDTTFSIVVPGP
jgi:hypothetical protein